MIQMPKFDNGTKGGFKDMNSFIASMYPAYYDYYIQHGVSPQQAEIATNNVMHLIALESTYGTSNVAINNHNYGGYGYNGKTYKKYNTDLDFVNDHAAYTMRKGLHNAKNIKEYATMAKKLGYYTDSLENYLRNMSNMKMFNQRLSKVSAANRNIRTRGITINTPDGNRVVRFTNPDLPLTEPLDNTYVQKPNIDIIQPISRNQTFVNKYDNLDVNGSEHGIYDLLGLNSKNTIPVVESIGHHRTRLQMPSIKQMMMQQIDPVKQLNRLFEDYISDVMFPMKKQFQMPNLFETIQPWKAQ